MTDYMYIRDNIEKVRRDIESAAQGRQVELVLATKTVDADRIAYAVNECGIKYIGENKVQELLGKYERLKELDCEIHFIGTLQKNKVKYIIDKVSLIQSVGSISLAGEIDRQARAHGLVMNVLLEVNIGCEENKSGFLPEQIPEALRIIRGLEGINVRGLMTMAPVCEDKRDYNKYFSKTYQIFIDNLQEKSDNIDRRILSMGMSASFVQAVQCGATMVRVGSAVFGARIPQNM